MKLIFCGLAGRFHGVFPAVLAVLVGCSTACAASSGCEVRVEMEDYSVCVPQGWNVLRNAPDDSVEVCNRAERRLCATDPFGYPRPGSIVVNIIPSDRGYGIYQSPEELNEKRRLWVNLSPLSLI